jgi:TRAP-type C4-dicarboxylate transport system permease small subunit
MTDSKKERRFPDYTRWKTPPAVTVMNWMTEVIGVISSSKISSHVKADVLAMLAEMRDAKVLELIRKESEDFRNN